MARAPEPLRLFDPPGDEPRAGAEVGSAEGSLDAVAEAARLVVKAQARFAAAVSAARAAGCSWRRIGTAAGVPYQSLHRSFVNISNRT